MKKIITSYREYLRKKRYVPQTIRKYGEMLEYFLEWQKQEGLQQISYPDMLTYIRYLQQEGKSTVTINKYLLSVRHYFDYRIKEGKQIINPAKDLQVRGSMRKVIRNILEKKDLDELYNNYQGKHRIMLGLIIYQGLTVGELERLEPLHIDLQKGSLYVPAGPKSNSRTLKLEAGQIYELMQAKAESKEKLIANVPLQNRAQKLGKELRAINPKVRNVKQLRASVIVHWLQSENLRQAQYMAGHKNVISTEMYLQENLEDLKEQLNKYHPLQ